MSPVGSAQFCNVIGQQPNLSPAEALAHDSPRTGMLSALLVLRERRTGGILKLSKHNDRWEYWKLIIL